MFHVELAQVRVKICLAAFLRAAAQGRGLQAADGNAAAQKPGTHPNHTGNREEGS
jgi:hypothetical protein